MPQAAKMDVLQREVGGDQDFVPARHVEDGAIVADPTSRLLGVTGCGTSNSLDEFELFRGHLRPSRRVVKGGPVTHRITSDTISEGTRE
jgi:hypothetical protein